MSDGLAGHIEELKVLSGHDERPRTVHVEVAGRSGVHKVSIREHRLLADADCEHGGHDLGPDPIELLLAALGTSLARAVLLTAAERDIRLDGVEVDVTRTADAGLAYGIAVAGPALGDALRSMWEGALARSEVLTLIGAVTPVSGALTHRR